jgi:hypothetical protein
MGNHEHCVDCGESSFHLDRPCDPVKVAEVKAEEKRRDDNYKRRCDAAKQIGAMLASKGQSNYVHDSTIEIL